MCVCVVYTVTFVIGHILGRPLHGLWLCSKVASLSSNRIRENDFVS